MNTKDEILNFLRQHKQEFMQRFSVRKIGLYGSFLRSESGDQSDVDILVQMDQPTFDHYMDLKFFLERVFKHPVDLVLAESVKQRLKPLIAQEVNYA